MRARALLTDPAVGFLAVGLAVFAAWRALAPDGRPEVRVELASVQAMVTAQEELAGRPFTDEERDEVLAGMIDDEVLIAEALRRGIHLSDGRTRKRLTQIMRGALASDVPPAPSTAELQAWFRDNVDRFSRDASVTVDHVFFPWEVGISQDEVEAALESLRGGADPSTFRASEFDGGGRLRELTRSDIVTRIGAPVADALESLGVGAWSEPLETARGRHLVRIVERHPATVPTFDDVEDYVRQDFEFERARELQQGRIDTLRESYRVELVGE
ncbi:MAG: peptidyl-prolyl cis-trans isomerase [Planctomycetota bacterium]